MMSVLYEHDETSIEERFELMSCEFRSEQLNPFTVCFAPKVGQLRDVIRLLLLEADKRVESIEVLMVENR